MSTRRMSDAEARLVFVSAVAIVIVIAASAVAVGLEFSLQHGASGVASGVTRTVATSTDLSATRGKVVYSDNFHDPGMGWVTSTAEPRGTTFTYTADGYQIVATGLLVHSVVSPYRTPVQQVSASLTATQAAGSPPNTGFGVLCRRGAGASLVRYELYVTTTKWAVVRRDGLAGATNRPIWLRRGTPPALPSATPMMVVGVCATQADGVTTRVVLFVNGIVVADIMDTAAVLPSEGWLTGMLVVSSDKAPSMVTMAEFDERNVAG